MSGKSASDDMDEERSDRPRRKRGRQSGEEVPLKGKQINIQTIQATANLALPTLDLIEFVKNVKNAQYDRRINAQAALMEIRVEGERITVQVFVSGKMVIMGAKSELQALIAARRSARKVQNACAPSAKFVDFKVNNVSAFGSLGYEVLLDHVARMEYFEGETVTYERDRFPSVSFKHISPKFTASIFVNGRVTMAGARSEKELYEGFEKLWKRLKPFAAKQPVQELSTQYPLRIQRENTELHKQLMKKIENEQKRREEEKKNQNNHIHQIIQQNHDMKNNNHTNNIIMTNSAFFQQQHYAQSMQTIQPGSASSVSAIGPPSGHSRSTSTTTSSSSSSSVMKIDEDLFWK